MSTARAFLLAALLTATLFTGCGAPVPKSITPVAVVPTEPVKIDLHGVKFADEAHHRGLTYVYPERHRPMRTNEAFGAGCALFDYDNDGWQDVLLVAEPTLKLFRNGGGGTFRDVSVPMGLSDTKAAWHGCAVGDYDGDGWLDLVITGFHRLLLLRNDGGKKFIDVTAAAGLDRDNHNHWGASAGLMDLDGDQFLDLVILNYVVFGPESKQYCELSPGVKSGCPPREYLPERGDIWKNVGGKKFEMIPGDHGMDSTHGVQLVLAYSDLDDDGLLDVYIGNDGTLADLLHNLGGMKFENRGLDAGVAGIQMVPMAAMGSDFADFDRDGKVDLTVTNFQDRSFTIFRNEGNVLFLDYGVPTGISPKTRNRLGFGAKWLDFDNDAWVDVCYANGHVYDNVDSMTPGVSYRQSTMLFRNERGKTFSDLVPGLGTDVRRPLVGRGSASGDIDNDGRIDMLIIDLEGPVMLLHNLTETPHHWLTIDLHGQQPNTFAYGARVTGRAGSDVWVQEVSPASSYLSSSDPRIHFGLGELKKLDTLTIRWPNGQEQVLKEVKADQFLRVDQ